MDGGMIRDAIEPENLIQSKPQKILEHWLLRPPDGLLRDQPIQRHLPSCYTIDKLLAEGAVDAGKPCLSELLFQEMLDIITARGSSLQNPASNFSWILTVHHL